MSKLFVLFSSVSGFLTVAIGAFGAHKLDAILKLNGYKDVFETGVKYQMFHTIALLGLALLIKLYGESQNFLYAGYSFLFGIIIFSGSLYVLSITGFKKLGMVTPIGGVLFLIAWGLMFFELLKK